MDADLELALTASRAEQDQLDEDRQLQEAIRLSLMEDNESSTSFEDQLKQRSAKMKRKAEDELRADSAKRSTSESIGVDLSESRNSQFPAEAPSSHSSNLAPPNATITYTNGALRITRTPGRRKSKNCVNLEDVIHKRLLISACIFSFFIGGEELYDHLPLSHTSNNVPIYIGRDANMDPMVEVACQQSNIPFKDKLGKKQLQSITPNLQQLYAKHYGQNYHAFYAWARGSSHSKILLLVYPEFLRVVITSCNMMDIDTVLGDNHWYIHDLPKLSTRSTSEPSPFEEGLLDHLRALGTPDAFIDSIQGMYDYSKVKVHLTTSVPFVCAGIKAEKHGLLRIRRVVQELGLRLPAKSSDELKMEICTASIGDLSSKWLNVFNDCALGKEIIKISDEDRPVPDLKLIYPSIGDVKRAHESCQEAASNIGCHIRPWDNASNDIKNLFRHYESKDTGRLFHQKLVLAYNPQDTKALPYYIYVGSANLSQSAWGTLEQDKKGNKATCDTKISMTNFECGVVIPGNFVEGLLEEGSESWQNGVVPYNQDAKRYDLPKDRPWNDPRWVQSRGEYS